MPLRRASKAILLTCGAFLSIVLLIVLIERTRGVRQLNEVLNQLRHANVELDPAKFHTNSVPDPENAAIALIPLASDLRAFSAPPDLPPMPAMKFRAGGEAVSYVRSSKWSNENGDSAAWADFEEAHADALGWFDDLTNIAQRPRFLMPGDISKGTADMELTALAPMPAVSRILRLIALYDLHQKNDQRAAEAIITLLNIYAAKSEDPWIICHLVRWTHTRTAFTLTWELLQNASLDDATWQRLQSSWQQLEFLKDLEQVRRGETAGTADFFVRLKRSNDYGRHILDNFSKIESDIGGTWYPPLRGGLLYNLHLPLWRVLWADQDFAYTMRYHEVEFALARMSATKKLGRRSRGSTSPRSPGRSSVRNELRNSSTRESL